MRLQARKPPPLTTTVLWWVCGLLLALAPTLGQMHRVLHGGGYGAITLPAALHVQQHQNGDDRGLPRLFGKHSAADCWLLDQWTWAHPRTHLPILPPLAVADPIPAPPYWHSGAVQVAAFQARAPPPFGWLG